MNPRLLLLLVLPLAGCSLLGHDRTVGDLAGSATPLADVPLPRVSHEDVRNEYRSLLEIVEDVELREQIERRIAGVYMLEGDHQQLVGVPPSEDGYFAPAIESYNEIISKYPGDPDNAEALYQLAKAYDLDGKDALAKQKLAEFIRQYPTSPRLAEVYFRKGDIHFRDAEYEQAEGAYQSVIDLGQESAFLNSSYYLLGWSRYKQSNYEAGLEAFSEVLARLVPEDGKVERLDKVERSLVDDTLDIMSLSLAYGGGAEKINRLYAGRPETQKYLWLLYDSLGKHFLEKERYEDSATSYREFVVRNPVSDRAPEMHAEMIRAYIQGDFRSQVLPEKERYVANYGIRSDFWRSRGGKVEAKVVDHLEAYLDELARHYHGAGQALNRRLDGFEGEDKEKRALAREEKDSFLKAADYYGQFMETFPSAPNLGEVVYMRAEALFDGGDYVNAIAGYEQAAYGKAPHEHGADAGYAAIIAYQRHGEQLASEHGPDSERLTQWRSRSVDSQLRFVATYGNDPRSGTVLAKASEELFALERYEKALEVAESVVARKAGRDPKLSRTAYGVIAHSQYALGNYAEAEAGYREQLQYMDERDEERDVVLERVATAAYKQGDEAVRANDVSGAIEHFLRIKAIAPDSEARVAAQYDAATHMMALERWNDALNELLELRAKFPEHELSEGLSKKIAYAYEKDGQLERAADEYAGIATADPEEDARREALFLAAELYERAGSRRVALEHFKTWVSRYEEPFGDRMEARYHIARLYKEDNDMVRHLYWLRRIIEADSEAGGARTDRSRWLAAWANAEYGDYWVREFRQIRLRVPLEKWIPKKSEKLKNALDRFEKAAGFGIFEISSRASFSIGELYAEFARELMASPRPKGLSAIERQQYEVLLEEQAIPFEDLAMEMHQTNIESAWSGKFNVWVGRSFASMAKLSPARFDKPEMTAAYGDGIR